MRIDRRRAGALYCFPKMARKSTKKARAERKDKGWLAWVLGSADSFGGYLEQSRGLALSFVLIAPLLLAYEVALLYYPPAQPKGAGRFLKDVFHAVFHTRAGMALNIIVALFLLLAIFLLARRRRLRLGFIVPMVLESAGWAVALVAMAVLICYRLPNVRLAVGAAGSTALSDVVNSLGAGVYEEILFRLLLTSALFLAGLRMFKQRTGYAAAFAAVISAAIFALCHIWAWDEPFKDPRIWIYLLFYFTSGVFFALLYTFRGLGVAVYTHVIYDIVVFLGGG